MRSNKIQCGNFFHKTDTLRMLLVAQACHAQTPLQWTSVFLGPERYQVGQDPLVLDLNADGMETWRLDGDTVWGRTWQSSPLTLLAITLEWLQSLSDLGNAAFVHLQVRMSVQHFGRSRQAFADVTERRIKHFLVQRVARHDVTLNLTRESNLKK